MKFLENHNVEQEWLMTRVKYGPQLMQNEFFFYSKTKTLFPFQGIK